MGILEDTREIEWVQFYGCDDDGVHGVQIYAIGLNHVTHIVAEGNPGQMAMVPWFVIYIDNGKMVRLNATSVISIGYDEDVNDNLHICN